MTKVLIVEDDPLMSRMYQKIFSFEKFEVEIASNGEEGLAKVASFNPVIILLDVMMPKKNGLEVLEDLKANPKTKNIPVVMLTNLAGQQDAETAMAKGAVKYIVKSEHDPKEVTNMVKEIIAGYTRNEVPAAVVHDSQQASDANPAIPINVMSNQSQTPHASVDSDTPTPPAVTND